MNPFRVGQIGCLLLLALAVSAAPDGGGHGPALATAGASGSFSFANSKESQAIFSATNIGPGRQASGTVTISNTGDIPGSMTLSQTDLVDTPGPGGGTLSDRLRLVVRDMTGGAVPQVLYDGRLRGLPDVPAGTIAPGLERTYDFAVQFPDGGPATGPSSGDNVFAAGSVQATYVWTAVEATDPDPDPGPDPGPDPNPIPIPPSPGPAAPGPTTDTQAPLVRLKLRRSRRMLRRGYVLLVVRCDEACYVQPRGQWRVAGTRPRAWRLRERHVAAVRWQRLRLRLPRSAPFRTALASGQRISLRVALAVRDEAGNERKLRGRARLKP